jgi:hypothetical protein
MRLVEGRDEDAVALLLDDSETPDPGGTPLAVHPHSRDEAHADRAGADARQLLGEVTSRLLHPWLPVVHVGLDPSNSHGRSGSRLGLN